MMGKNYRYTRQYILYGSMTKKKNSMEIFAFRVANQMAPEQLRSENFNFFFFTTEIVMHVTFKWSEYEKLG